MLTLAAPLDWLIGYYGTDWAAMVFMFLSAWRLGNHKRDGWLFGAIACAFWIAFNMVAESAPAAFANVVFLILQVRGFQRWKAASGEPQAQARE